MLQYNIKCMIKVKASLLVENIFFMYILLDLTISHLVKA